jgi:hypothetical protein
MGEGTGRDESSTQGKGRLSSPIPIKCMQLHDISSSLEDVLNDL